MSRIATRASQRSSGNSAIGATCWNPALGITVSSRRSARAPSAPRPGCPPGGQVGGQRHAGPPSRGLEVDRENLGAAVDEVGGDRPADAPAAPVTSAARPSSVAMRVSGVRPGILIGGQRTGASAPRYTQMPCTRSPMRCSPARRGPPPAGRRPGELARRRRRHARLLGRRLRRGATPLDVAADAARFWQETSRERATPLGLAHRVVIETADRAPARLHGGRARRRPHARASRPRPGTTPASSTSAPSRARSR